MANTTGTINWYNKFFLHFPTVMNLATDEFVIGLCDNTYIPDAAQHEVVADVFGELSGNGYARQTLTVSFTRSGQVAKFDFSDPTFSAVGGQLSARWYFIFNNTVAVPEKPLVCFGLLDQNNQDVVTDSGNDLMFSVPASGFFTIRPTP